MVEIASKTERYRQLSLDGFQELLDPRDREIPLSEFKGRLSLGSRINAYINFIWALSEVPLRGPYPEILVDPVERTAVVIRRYPKGGAIQYG